MGMRDAGVRYSESVGAAVRDVDVVIAAVPAASASEVLHAAVPHLRRGQLYVDPAPSLPAAKREAAALVERAGSEYVDAAVLDSVVTSWARVSMLAAGGGAARWQDEAQAVGPSADVAATG